MIRRTRFGHGYNPYLVQAAEQTSTRVEIITPTRGLHRGDAASDLGEGYTPDASNFVVSGGYLTPRSGLSRWRTGTSQLSGAALGAFRVSDLTGSQYIAAASDRTIAVFDPTTDGWRALSSHTTQSDVPSGTSRQFWEGAYLYDAASDRNLTVLTNANDVPKVFAVEGSVTTYSNLTDFVSLASKAKSVCAFDNRLVFFNTSTETLTQPTRVLWSVRGRPRNYQLLDGAGFEDVLDMRGIGQKVLADHGGVLLFTDEEIWRGRRRGDAYVFDFYAVSHDLGCPYPKTVVKTPIGVIFLGADLELYVVQGDSVHPLGPAREGGASRVQNYLHEFLHKPPETAWAVYDPARTEYTLFFNGPESVDGFPTRALVYNLTENSFLPQSFAFELSAGVEFKDTGIPSQWDETVASWDEVATTWDNQVRTGSGFAVHAFSSAGTSYRFDSSQTNDDGSTVSAHWTSHALSREDSMRMESLTELWVEYTQHSAGSIVVTFAGDLSMQDADVRTVSLPTASAYGRVIVPGYVTGAAPHFRIEITNGSQPKLGRFQALLRDAGLYGGAA